LGFAAVSGVEGEAASTRVPKDRRVVEFVGGVQFAGGCDEATQVAGGTGTIVGAISCVGVLHDMVWYLEKRESRISGKMRKMRKQRCVCCCCCGFEGQRSFVFI
jgi:hypothetical protein